jgi:hypothetical protein
MVNRVRSTVLGGVLGLAILPGCAASVAPADDSADAASVPPQPPALDAGPVSDAGRDVQTDASRPDRVAPDITSPPPPSDGEPYVGRIHLLQALDTNGPTATSSALFYRSDGTFYQPHCSVTQVDWCVVSECAHPGTEINSERPPYTILGSAGTVRVDDPAGSIALEPDATAGYAGAELALARWTAGEQITVAASGGDVPAFARQIVFPAHALVTAPAREAEVLSAARNAPFALAWRPVAGVVRATLINGTVADGTVHEARAVCNFDGAAGAGTVPSTMTAAMIPGAPVTLDVTTEAQQQFLAGSSSIFIFASDRARRVTVNFR